MCELACLVLQLDTEEVHHNSPPQGYPALRNLRRFASAQKAAAPDGSDHGDDLVVDLLSGEQRACDAGCEQSRRRSPSGSQRLKREATTSAHSSGPVGRSQRSGSRRTRVPGCRWCRRIDGQAPRAEVDALAALVTLRVERLDSSHIKVLRGSRARPSIGQYVAHRHDTRAGREHRTQHDPSPTPLPRNE